jgi:hypothetical protein
VFGKTAIAKRQLVQVLFACPLTEMGVEQLIRKLEIMQGGQGVKNNIAARPRKLMKFLSLMFGPGGRLPDVRKDGAGIGSALRELIGTRLDVGPDGPGTLAQCYVRVEPNFFSVFFWFIFFFFAGNCEVFRFGFCAEAGSAAIFCVSRLF